MPTVVDVHDYERLYRATRGIRGEIRRDFRRRLREAAKIGAQAAKDEIRRMPATHRYTAAGARRHVTPRGKIRLRGLRSTLAANISVKVERRGVRIVQSSAGLVGNSAKDLPRDIDRGGWRHPTFGHDPEVFQKGHHYFKQAIDDKREEMLTETQKVLDDITERLTG